MLNKKIASSGQWCYPADAIFLRRCAKNTLCLSIKKIRYTVVLQKLKMCNVSIYLPHTQGRRFNFPRVLHFYDHEWSCCYTIPLNLIKSRFLLLRKFFVSVMWTPTWIYLILHQFTFYWTRSDLFDHAILHIFRLSGKKKWLNCKRLIFREKTKSYCKIVFSYVLKNFMK